MFKIPVNIEKNQKAYLAGIGVIAVILVVMTVRPLVKKISQLQQIIKMTQMNIKDGLKVQLKKDKILKEYSECKIYLTKQGESDQEITSNFLKELETIAQKSKISIVSLSPSEVSGKESENKNVYYADFKAEGPIEVILRFLDNIQESKSLIKIDRFNISAKGKNVQNLKFDAKISITIP